MPVLSGVLQKTLFIAILVLALAWTSESRVLAQDPSGHGVEGVYLGSGTLVQPCQFPGGPYTYNETIPSMQMTVTNAGEQLLVDAQYVVRREDGSQYDHSLIAFVSLASDGSISGDVEYMFDSTTAVHLVTSGTFEGDMLNVVFVANITYLPDAGTCEQTITVSLRFDRSTTRAQLTWEAPDGGELAPPRNLTARILNVGEDSPARPEAASDAAGRRALTGYRIYRSNQPNVQATPDNLFTSVPPSQTSVNAPVASSGSFFVVTATYDDGESAPSNETGTGLPGAVVTKVSVKPAKIVAKGTGFSDVVEVYVDGYRFESPATVKNGKKVIQKGRLSNGQTIAEYVTPGRMVIVSFLNSDGSITRSLASR